MQHGTDILIWFGRGLHPKYLSAEIQLGVALWSIDHNIRLYSDEQTALDLAIAGF